MSPSELKALLEKTEAIVLQAAAIIRDHWDRPKDIRRKGRIDLVTQTDEAVENFLKEKLGEILPGSSFLAEESSSQTVPGALTWIIDPVDGTTNYAHGLPYMCTSVALWDGGQTVLGVVNAPILNECFCAVRGQGAFLNGRPMKVSSEDAPVAALVGTGFPYDIPPYLDRVVNCMRVMLPQVQGMRRAGAAALDMAYVACGRLDAFYEAALKPWDVAAGWLLITEAGGAVSQIDAMAPYVLGADTLFASNGALHESLGALLVKAWDAAD